MKYLALLPLLAIAAHASSPSPADIALAQKAVADLRAVVANDHELPRLHAAENLAILGEPNPFGPIENQIPALLSQPVYRIVTWRVQAREAQFAHKDIAPYARPVELIFIAQPDASDRPNAAETLGKIGYYPPQEDLPVYRKAAEADDELSAEARWVLADSGKESDERALAAFLQDRDEKMRGYAAYALRFLPKIRHETYVMLVDAARKESKSSSSRCYLYAAALVHAAKVDRAELLQVVEHYVDHGDAEDKFEAMNALAEAGGREELGRLSRYVMPADPFVDRDADFQVGSSNAILHILRR